MEVLKDNEKKKLFDRNELRRLVKAARDKDLRKLADWGKQFEQSIRDEFEVAYKKSMTDELNNMIDIFILTIVYTLHFNESTMFGNKRIKSFLDDLLATIDNFNDGSYSPDEYREILKKEGIEVVSKNEGGDSNGH